MNCKNIVKQRGALCIVAFVTTLVGCGGGADSNPVPPGAEIVLSMTEYQWEIAPAGQSCLVDPNRFHDHLVNITVINSEGSPVGDVDVHATLDLSDATYSGMGVMALYDDKNGNGAGDSDELVSAEGQGAYSFKTAKYTGSKMLWVRVNLSCPLRGQLTVFSGAATATIDIEVAERAEDQPAEAEQIQ